jgi:hypothetical protein
MKISIGGLVVENKPKLRYKITKGLYVRGRTDSKLIKIYIYIYIFI